MSLFIQFARMKRDLDKRKREEEQRKYDEIMNQLKMEDMKQRLSYNDLLNKRTEQDINMQGQKNEWLLNPNEQPISEYEKKLRDEKLRVQQELANEHKAIANKYNRLETNANPTVVPQELDFKDFDNSMANVIKVYSTYQHIPEVQEFFKGYNTVAKTGNKDAVRSFLYDFSKSNTNKIIMKKIEDEENKPKIEAKEKYQTEQKRITKKDKAEAILKVKEIRDDIQDAEKTRDKHINDIKENISKGLIDESKGEEMIANENNSFIRYKEEQEGFINQLKQVYNNGKTSIKPKQDTTNTSGKYSDEESDRRLDSLLKNIMELK